MSSRRIEAAEAIMDEEDSDADGEVRIVDRDCLQRVRQQARSSRDREDESHDPGDNHEEENHQDDSDGSSDALLNQPHVVRCSNNTPAIHHEKTPRGWEAFLRSSCAYSARQLPQPRSLGNS